MLKRKNEKLHEHWEKQSFFFFDLIFFLRIDLKFENDNDDLTDLTYDVENENLSSFTKNKLLFLNLRFFDFFFERFTFFF